MLRSTFFVIANLAHVVWAGLEEAQLMIGGFVVGDNEKGIKQALTNLASAFKLADSYTNHQITDQRLPQEGSSRRENE